MISEVIRNIGSLELSHQASRPIWLSAGCVYYSLL